MEDKIFDMQMRINRMATEGRYDLAELMRAYSLLKGLLDQYRAISREVADIDKYIERAESSAYKTYGEA
ncbi:MAG: hypothetical protein LUD47_07795 [Clostridia bacterium]|nr:hypothetical protein [Clostridia bacterium]